MYLYVWLALKEEAEEEEEEKCKILAEVGSLCWNSEGELQKLRSSLKVGTLKKTWGGVRGATQCKPATKSLKVSFDVERFTENISLASQLS